MRHSSLRNAFCAAALFCFALLATPARAEDDAFEAPASFATQTAVVGQVLGEPFVVMVTDQHGAPLAGATVWFDIDYCVAADTTQCPDLKAYGSFGGTAGATVVADRNGRAESPPFTAGTLPAHYTVHAKTPPQMLNGRYYLPAGAVAEFAVNQVAATNDGTITPGYTGNWFDTAQSGHGFSIEVLADNQMLAQWYVFGPNGGQTWLVATGPITGNHAVLQAFLPVGSGGRFPPNFDPSQVKNQAWGTITFTFADCANGAVSWQSTLPGYSAGELPIARLTSPAGLACP
jgi:hypothetical protein